MSKIVYVNEKIKEREMKFNYKHGKYGAENIKFKFKATPILNPLGDISFVTGYEDKPVYDNLFLMTAQEAIELGKMLMDAGYDAMRYKRIDVEKEEYEARLSFLVLKGLIDRITIERTEEFIDNYEKPYHEYTISAFRGEKEILSYCTAANLSYFNTENEIEYWIDCMTDKKKIDLEFIGWDPYEELKQRLELIRKKMSDLFNSEKK